MNIFEKLQKCRVELQKAGLKKSGSNTHSNYSYFELEDFLPKINELFLENKLCGLVSFTQEIATLRVVNMEKPEEVEVFTSPMSTAKLPACHEVQNLGAVETYERRYLYMTALEITESDILDKTHDKNSQRDPQPNKNTSKGNLSNGENKPLKNDSAASKEQVAELFKLAEEKKKQMPDFDFFKLLADMEERKKITSRYTYTDKQKTKIQWTTKDYEEIKSELEVPF